MAASEGRARSQLTRQRIVEATVELLVERGFASTTMRAVAAQARTSVGAVQYHFPSKQALLLESVMEIFQEVSARLAELGRAPGEASTRAQRIVRTLWVFYSGSRYVAASEILLGMRMEPGADKPLVRARDLLTRAYHGAWDKLLADSPLPAAQRPGLLQFVIATLRGLGIIAVHDREPGFFEPQLRILEGLVAQALIEGRLPQAASGDVSDRQRRLAVA